MDNICTKYSDLTKIPENKYQGYLWYSDAENPTIFNNEELKIDLDKHLFIIEGNLYYKSENEEISISIRFRDGKYFINQFNLAQARSIKTEINKSVYLAHKIQLNNTGETYYTMYEAWEIEKKPLGKDKQDDPLSGMETLKPTWAAFGGFTNISPYNKK